MAECPKGIMLKEATLTFLCPECEDIILGEYLKSFDPLVQRCPKCETVTEIRFESVLIFKKEES